jgi:two-component system chemotaxis response regulator CheB
MPLSAIAHAPVDHVVPMGEIAGLVTRLAREPADPLPPHLPGVLAAVEGDEPGLGSDIVCPICHGKLTETEVNGYHSFHCHVGHSFSLESVAAEQAEEVERALWSAARALEESAALAGRLAAMAKGDMRQRFSEKEQAQIRDADLIRRILLAGGVLARPDQSQTGDVPVTAEPNESAT